jgi:hypothetical protein
MVILHRESSVGCKMHEASSVPRVGRKKGKNPVRFSAEPQLLQRPGN